MATPSQPPEPPADGFDRVERGVLIAGAALRGLQLLWTGPFTRTHDIMGHLDYLRVVAGGALPAPADCWQCHQPPLAYLVGGGILAAAEAAGLAEPDALRLLQGTAVLVSIAAMLLGGRWLAQVLAPGRTRRLAVALVALWPALLLHAPRIGNDGAVALLSVATLLLLDRALAERPPTALPAAAATALLALIAKASALLLFPIVLAVAAWRGLRPGARPAALGAVALLLGGMGAAAGSGLIAPPWDASAAVANAAGLPEHLRVPPGLATFVELAPQAWLEQPFAQTLAGQPGQASFLHFLGKTSMFGEFTFHAPWRGLLAMAMGLLLPLVALCTLWGAVQVARAPSPRRLLLVASAAVVLGGVAALRLAMPYSTSADFRYALAAVPPLAGLWALGAHAGPETWQRVARGAAMAFLVASAVFYGLPLG